MKKDPAKTPTPPKVYIYMRFGNPEQLNEPTKQQRQKLRQRVLSSFPESYEKAGREGSR